MNLFAPNENTDDGSVWRVQDFDLEIGIKRVGTRSSLKNDNGCFSPEKLYSTL